jgi:hypothetical protein
VNYTFAYAYKHALDGVFQHSLIQQLETGPTWGSDKTTCCVRAYDLIDKMEFHLDVEGDFLEGLTISDVFQDEDVIAAGDSIRLETRKDTTIRIQTPITVGQPILNKIYFLTKA